MKRNLKWSVLAVAIVAANASVAQAGSGPDINFEWNSTINDEVNNTVNNDSTIPSITSSTRTWTSP